jgi:hypothetical protein
MENIRKLLKNYDSEKVDIYISYLKSLKAEKNKEGKLVNWWFTQVSDTEFADAFKKVASTGLFIDGDSITLTYRKKLVIVYDYHAYENKVLLSYPESIFDFQLVYKDDSFTFRKESGKVIYSHVITNPFDIKKQIQGAYGVIKNRKGEFIEFLTLDDIQKMKNTSNMKNIWNTWFDRMVLKSIIKRICNIHFKDIVKDIDAIDNETNNLDATNINELIQNDIENAKTLDDLNKIYNQNIGNIEDIEGFINLLSEKKKELKNDTLS